MLLYTGTLHNRVCITSFHTTQSVLGTVHGYFRSRTRFDVYYNITDTSHIPITVDVVVMSIVLVVVLGSAPEVDVVVMSIVLVVVLGSAAEVDVAVARNEME